MTKIYIILDKQISLGDEPGHPCVNINLATHDKKFAKTVLTAYKTEIGGGTKKWPRFSLREIEIDDPTEILEIYKTIENYIDSCINGPW